MKKMVIFLIIMIVMNVAVAITFIVFAVEAAKTERPELTALCCVGAGLCAALLVLLVDILIDNCYPIGRLS